MTTMNIVLDDSVAETFNSVYSRLGISPQEAFSVFARRSIKTGGFPFRMKRGIIEGIREKIDSRRFKKAFGTLRDHAQKSGLSLTEADIEAEIALCRVER